MTLVKDSDHALEILGLSRGASKEEITSRYRELAKKYHPDFYHSEDIPEELKEHANEKIKVINEAYRIALEALAAPGVTTLSSPGVEIAWKFDATYQVFGPPVIVDGVIYFCTRGPALANRDGTLFAVDLATGKERWRFKTGGEATNSLVVVDGVAYFGSGDCHVYAIDVNTPDELWRAKTQNRVRRTPVVGRGMVFSQEFEKNALTGLDVRTGKPKWSCMAAGEVVAGPAVAEGTVYFSTLDAYLYSVDIKTRKVKWRIRVRDYPVSEPVICDDMVIYLTSDTSLIALDRETGQQRWTLRIGHMEVIWSRGIGRGDGMIFAPSKDGTFSNGRFAGCLSALNPNSGEALWTSTTNMRQFYTPDFHDGVVYVSSLTGPVSSFDAKTGRKLWEFDLQRWTYSLAAHQEMVYVGVMDGIYALKPLKVPSEDSPSQDAEKQLVKKRPKKRITAK
jgi:eukaryotic-like serine/threonine-protein kinase